MVQGRIFAANRLPHTTLRCAAPPGTLYFSTLGAFLLQEPIFVVVCVIVLFSGPAETNLLYQPSYFMFLPTSFDRPVSGKRGK